MSSQSNNHRRNHLGFIPSSPPFHSPMNERGDFDPWWLSLQERMLTLPSRLMSFPGIPRPPMQVLVFDNNIPRHTNLSPRSMPQTPSEDFVLAQDEQKKALSKLKKEIYNPTPKKIIQRLSKFYKENNVKKEQDQKGKQPHTEEQEQEEDDKRCAICLEDFEPKEVVVLTPCDHMFHEDCIVPWVKSSGKCPVCRFVICERIRETGIPSMNDNNLVNDPLVSYLTVMGDSRSRFTRGATSMFYSYLNN